ncbi:MAG: hypothetical protein JO227_23625 [Acetobacteraceae bacterium]|nr:hypothetical protein [Acetobacteraceae bacterium]
MLEIRRWGEAGPRAGRFIRQRHAIELTLERLRRQPFKPGSLPERRLSALAAEAVALAAQLSPAGRRRLSTLLGECLAGEGTLVPLFHLVRTAGRQRARGFSVVFTGLEEGAPFDLLLKRAGSEAEVACDVMSAEEGRRVHRGAWFRLADSIDPDLQTWLSAHPGRYVLKMLLTQGLQGGLHDAISEGTALAELHRRITRLLESHHRRDHDEAIVLRLDPLLLAAAQADDTGLLPSLRREFGPEAHLSVTAAGRGLFVMAARAGRENEIAAAIRRRMASIAPRRLTGTRPAILAMFVEDTDRAEWHGLRERMEIEGEARQFLTFPEARSIVAVSCSSRFELYGLPEPHAVAEGELRFRSPVHPAARAAALAPAVLSSV